MSGLFVGRFQPFHRGHLELVRTVTARAPGERLVLAVGSAEQSYTWENPFTAGERIEMIGRALEEARVEGTTIVPVPDLRRHALWVRYVEGMVPKFEHVYSHNPLTLLLFRQAGYATESPPLYRRATYEGAKVREALARGRDVGPLVPPAVAGFLKEIGARDRLKVMRPRPARGEAPAER